MSVPGEKDIYCLSNLIARYSSWIVYWNDFWSVGWTREILWIQSRWICTDLSMRGMCSTAHMVSDIMKDCSFMNLYIYQIFSPCHSCRASLGCDTRLVSNLISEYVRSRGLTGLGLVSVNLLPKFDLILIGCSFWGNLIHSRESLGSSWIETWWQKVSFQKLMLLVP